jgi:hypothetical protein
MPLTSSTSTPGRYQLTATCGDVEILRQTFDDLDEAHRAFSEALTRYPDCEVRLTSRDAVLITAAPARSR